MCPPFRAAVFWPRLFRRRSIQIFPGRSNTIGDILIETPEGDIIASAGGVVQIPLNGVGNNLGTVTLRAGTKDADGMSFTSATLTPAVRASSAAM
ncbi:MAG: hypothetical protein WDN00_12820 [Limisphaerales bacterium]